jgi:hypothetical protein
MTMETQSANLERVYGSIGGLVVAFCRQRIGQTFFAGELRAHVTAALPHIAPESPGRILRELKARGLVDYILVCRSASLYRVLGVA